MDNDRRLPLPTTGQVSLRERKKRKTMVAIQDQAFRLFAEQGYQATTVEQIAESAEVSPSTFFRYFATKKDVALHDSLDPLLIEEFKQQPERLTIIQAFRGAVYSVFADIPNDELERQLQRGDIILKEPELQTAMIEEFARNIDLLSELIAERLHRQVDDLSVRTLAGAIIGALLSVILQNRDQEVSVTEKDYFQGFDKALKQLEKWLPLTNDFDEVNR